VPTASLRRIADTWWSTVFSDPKASPRSRDFEGAGGGTSAGALGTAQALPFAFSRVVTFECASQSVAARLHVYDVSVEVTRKPAPTYRSRAISVP
jgi:hypothetical protein